MKKRKENARRCAGIVNRASQLLASRYILMSCSRRIHHDDPWPQLLWETRVNQINIEEALGCGGDVLAAGGERRVINKVPLRRLYISQSLMISSVFPSPYISYCLCGPSDRAPIQKARRGPIFHQITGRLKATRRRLDFSTRAMLACWKTVISHVGGLKGEDLPRHPLVCCYFACFHY